MADYHGSDGLRVNLYVAYYQSQRNGMSIHSPARCVPAGGWQIRSFERYILRPDTGRGAWPVNRALIERGNQRALVYYWFQERGRRLTSEYAARLYLFWDSLTVNHTDGALIRLVVPLPEDADTATFDAKLTRFASTADSRLRQFVPD
jgi:EpsI family protein